MNEDVDIKMKKKKKKECYWYMYKPSLKGLKDLTVVLTQAHCHPRTGLDLSHSLHHC